MTEDDRRTAAVVEPVGGVVAGDVVVVEVAGESEPLVSEPRMGAFYALRFPAFRLLWINALIFIFAVTAQGIARSWLAYEITGTNKGLAGVQLATGVAMLVGTPFGGVVADRFDKKWIVTATMLLVAASSAWVGICVLTDSVSYWMLIVSGAMQGLAFAFYSPARIALISSLVDRRTMPNAVVVTQLGYAGMLTLGPALAGVLLGTPGVGAAGLFLGSGVVCTVSAMSSLALPRSKVVRERGRGVSLFSDFHDAYSFIRTDRHIALLTVACLATVFFVFPYVAFLPELANNFDGGPRLFGWMSASIAAGSVLAGFFVARIAARANLVAIFATAGLGLGCGLLVVGLSPYLALTLALLPLLGGCVLAFQTTNQAMIMRHSPDELHGRLQAVVLLGYSGNGLAALPLGAIADEIGLDITFVLMGGFAILVNVVFVVLARRNGLMAAGKVEGP